MPGNLVKLTPSALYSRLHPLLDVLSMCSCEAKFVVGGCALDSTLWHTQRTPAHCVTHILISILACTSRGVLTPCLKSAGEVCADTEPSSNISRGSAVSDTFVRDLSRHGSKLYMASNWKTRIAILGCLVHVSDGMVHHESCNSGVESDLTQTLFQWTHCDTITLSFAISWLPSWTKFDTGPITRATRR